jgi:hypothetical protein
MGFAHPGPQGRDPPRKPKARSEPWLAERGGWALPSRDPKRYFTKQIEAALIRSNRVDVVSSLEEAADNRDERADQATHAGDESAKSQGQELASDFLLNGWILASDDRASGKLLRAYLTSVEIVETQNNKKAWVGQKRIKKLITSAP